MNEAQFTSAQDVRKFALGGNAIFTLISRQTGTRFTYRLRAKEEEGKTKLWFVSVLTGANNDTDYSYLGTIFASDPMTYRHGHKSKIGCKAKSAQGFEWFWRQISNGRLPNSVGVWHAGRCGRCGRTLSVPESIASGFGPECSQHV